MTIPINGAEPVVTECDRLPVHPVDSRYHGCCNAIGRHAAECSVLVVGRTRGLLDSAFTQAVQAAEDIADALDASPADAPLTAAVDMVTARAHLAAARRFLNRAVQAIDADAAAVQ